MKTKTIDSKKHTRLLIELYQILEELGLKNLNENKNEPSIYIDNRRIIIENKFYPDKITSEFFRYHRISNNYLTYFINTFYEFVPSMYDEIKNNLTSKQINYINNHYDRTHDFSFDYINYIQPELLITIEIIIEEYLKTIINYQNNLQIKDIANLLDLEKLADIFDYNPMLNIGDPINVFILSKYTSDTFSLPNSILELKITELEYLPIISDTETTFIKDYFKTLIS